VSFRPHGRASISPTNPRALGICDRCDARYNHDQLNWQFAWGGPRIYNTRILVCQSCLDKLQENGLRTIVLPPDPIPIDNARPEADVQDTNPLSGLGMSANLFMPQYGSFIGNLTGGGGLNAAFDANSAKPSWQSASNMVSNSSYNNYVGMNWAGRVDNLNMPSSLKPPVIRHSLVGFSITAPNDRSFLGNGPTSFVVQGSPTNTALYGAWTTISSGTTSGTPGETIGGECTGSLYQFHRVAFLGDQLSPVSIAQAAFNVAQIGHIVTAGSS